VLSNLICGCRSGRTIAVVGSSWYFDSCALQAIQGIPLFCRGGYVTTVDCSIGGGGPGEQAAKYGATVTHFGIINATGGSFAHCERFAIDAEEGTKVFVHSGQIVENQFGIQMSGECRIEIRSCTILCKEAAFKVDYHSRYSAKVFLSDNRIQGREWYQGMLPVRDSHEPDRVGTDDFSDLDVNG